MRQNQRASRGKEKNKGRNCPANGGKTDKAKKGVYESREKECAGPSSVQSCRGMRRWAGEIADDAISTCCEKTKGDRTESVREEG
jgi:hypothetical protein